MLFGEGPQIKNIAADLNKLFRQGSLLNQIGQTVEGDSTADQGTSDLLAARDPVIQEISVGMSGEQSARYTVSGAPPLTLPNSLGKPLKAWEVALSPYQDLHGYENPWPDGGGKNKLNPSFIQGSGVQIPISTRVVSDHVIPVVSGQTYTFSSDNYTDFAYVLNSSNADTLPFVGSHTYCGTSDTWVQADITFTATNSGYVAVVVKKSDESSITPTDVANVKMQFEESATSTSYAPYSNICPILGTDKVNLFVEESYDQSATPKAVIVMQDTIYGGTYDAVTGVGVIEWAKINVRGTDVYAWRLDLPVFGIHCVPIASFVQGSLTDKIANCLPTVGNSSLYLGTSYGICEQNNGGIGLAVQGVGTLNDMKNWVEENDLQVVYKLATPIPFTTDGHTIPTPTGTATTWATAEDGTVDSMEVTYVGKA